MKQILALACLLLILLVLCGRLAVREAQQATPAGAAAPGAEAATSGEWVIDAHGHPVRRGKDGLWSPYVELPCPECGGDGRLKGRYIGYTVPCWRCEGRGFVFPGLEQRQQEPLDRIPETPDGRSQFRLPRPGIYGGTP